MDSISIDCRYTLAGIILYSQRENVVKRVTFAGEMDE